MIRRFIRFSLNTNVLSKYKKRFALMICSPWVGNILSAIFHDRIPHFGCRIDTSGDVVTPTVKASLFWGLYESAETQFVKKYLRSDLDVVEIGSSIGVVTAHISKKLHHSRQLVCVEANSTLLKHIESNVALNSSVKNIHVIHGAISYKPNSDGTVLFHVSDKNTGSKIAEDVTAKNVVHAPAKTLSQILHTHQIKEYALVSDIEGAEADLLAYDAEALIGCQQLIIELHDSVLEGNFWGVDQMAQVIQNKHGFVIRSRHGAVYVFEKSVF